MASVLGMQVYGMHLLDGVGLIELLACRNEWMSVCQAKCALYLLTLVRMMMELCVPVLRVSV